MDPAGRGGGFRGFPGEVGMTEEVPKRQAKQGHENSSTKNCTQALGKSYGLIMDQLLY